MLSPSLKNWIRVLLKRTQALCLVRCKDVNSIEQLDCLFDNDCLEFLRLQDCEEMEYLINFEKMVSSQSSLPPQGIIAIANNLKELNLVCLPKLEKLCHGLPSHQLGFFGNLRVLKVLCCGRLGKAVFSYSFLRGRMKNLEHLYVESCVELQNVFHYQEEEEGRHGCDHEELLLLQILPKLRKLELYFLRGLINIWGGGRGIPIPIPIGSFNNLKEVFVYECNRLKNVFTFINIFAVLEGLQQLDSLTVYRCKVMKELINMADEDEKVKEEEEMEMMRKMSNVFPRLRVLNLSYLPELTCLYSREGGGGEQRNIVFDFPSLEIIQIFSCPKLKSLPLGSHSAPNLTQFNCSTKEWLQGLELDDEGFRSKLQSKARFGEPLYSLEYRNSGVHMKEDIV